MSAPPVCRVEIDGQAFEIASGETLIALEANSRMPVVFGCYSARCGICQVRVLRGGEHLSARNEMEEMLLGADCGETDRLACQCAVFGPAAFESAGRR